jgi:hypothetical protein
MMSLVMALFARVYSQFSAGRETSYELTVLSSVNTTSVLPSFSVIVMVFILPP